MSSAATVPAGGGAITSFQTTSSLCQYVHGSYDFQALGPEGTNQYLVLGAGATA